MLLPHAHRATAFHFLISKRLGFLEEEDGPAPLEPSPAGTMFMSVSREAIAVLQRQRQFHEETDEYRETQFHDAEREAGNCRDGGYIGQGRLEEEFVIIWVPTSKRVKCHY